MSNSLKIPSLKQVPPPLLPKKERHKQTLTASWGTDTFVSITLPDIKEVASESSLIELSNNEIEIG